MPRRSPMASTSMDKRALFLLLEWFEIFHSRSLCKFQSLSRGSTSTITLNHVLALHHELHGYIRALALPIFTFVVHRGFSLM